MKRVLNMTKKVILLLCILSLMMTSYPLVTRAQKVFKLSEAITLATKNSSDLYDITMESFKKNMELYQAREALRDMRKKEKTVRYSLLTTIKMPEKHGQPMEISKVFKIPQLQDDISNLSQKREQTLRKIRNDVQLEYLTLIEAKFAMDNMKLQLDEARSSHTMLKNKFKIGQATADSIKKKEDELKEKESSYQKTIVAFEKQKKVLSTLAGLDVTNGYSFEDQFIYVDINRQDFDKIHTYSMKTNYDLFMKGRESAMAALKTNIYLQDLKSNFGGRVSGVEAVLARSGPVNFDLLQNEYNKMLNKVDAIWSGHIRIPLFFFVLKIPKEWFMMEYSGIRYFDNEKFGLPLSVVEREKAFQAEATAKKNHSSKVEQLYMDLKTMQATFDESLKVSNQAVKDLETAARLNKMGRLSFEDFEQQKSTTRKLLDSVVTNLIAFNKIIYTYNYETSGSLEKFGMIGKYGISLKGLINGESFVVNEVSIDDDEKTILVGEWYTRYIAGDIKMEFGIKSLPEGVEATHYELYAYNGQRFGPKTRIDETLKHLRLHYGDSTLVRVLLYNEDKLVGEAELDGFDNGGTLNVIRIIEGEKYYKGTWTIEAVEGINRSRLSVTVDEALMAAQYQVAYEDHVISDKLFIEEAFEHFNWLLSDASGLTITFYNAQDEKIAVADLLEFIEDETGDSTDSEIKGTLDIRVAVERGEES